MRRLELQQEIIGRVEDHFPEDIARSFDVNDLRGVAEYFQETERDYPDGVEEKLRSVALNQTDRDWDQLADDIGRGKRPAEWLLEQVKLW
jgi:hypothetical protein